MSYRLKYEKVVKAGADVDVVVRNAARGSMTLSEAFDLTYEEYWKESKGEKTDLLNDEHVLKLMGSKTRVGDIDQNAIKKLKKKFYLLAINLQLVIKN